MRYHRARRARSTWVQRGGRIFGWGAHAPRSALSGAVGANNGTRRRVSLREELLPPVWPCKIAAIAEEVQDRANGASTSAQVPIIPDHEVLRVIGRGAYGEIWLARSLTGAFRAVKVVYRTTFESERAFQREFQGMSSFEPISRAHPGFVDILHVGRTSEYLYYIMELADDHVAGRKVDPLHYVPRTLKTDLDHRRSLSGSIRR